MEENGQMTLGHKDTSELTGPEKLVWTSLSQDPRHTEEIAQRCGMSLAEVLPLLYKLEQNAYASNTGSAYWRQTI